MVWPRFRHLPQAAFAFVGTYDRRLQAHRIGNHFLHHRRVAIQNLTAPIFKQVEQSRISDNAALQRLIQAGVVFARRQRIENGGVDQHGARLVKSSEQIFPRYQIDSCLPADSRVHLRQYRRRHLNDIDAAHIDRSQESGYVADYAAAESNQSCPAIRALFY